MRRKRHSGTDLIIDLTSLLDVIFIILAMYMCIFSDMAKNIQSENSTTGPINGATKIAEDLDNYILIESVYSSFDISKPQNRTLSFIAATSTGDLEAKEEAKKNVQEYKIESEDSAMQFEEFEKAVRDSIEKNSDRELVILKLNKGENTILYRDETRILEFFNKLAEDYPDMNFTIK